MKRAVMWTALAVAMAMSAGVVSAAESGQKRSTAAKATSLSPAQRGDMTRAFVNRWGAYVQRVYGTDVRVWSRRMVSTFVQADGVNFERALQRSTFEGAMAELEGRGKKLSDAKVINTLAAQSDMVTPMSPLDGIEDLVFTPLDPCRIVDTRNAGAGPILAGTNRGFYVWGFSSFTAQGGSATDCGGLATQAPQSVVLNVTVVDQTQLGFATLYPASAASVPTAATMVYYPNVIISNGATVTLGTSGNDDFRIFSQQNAHYVVDIVGYYDFPHATEFDCDPTFVSQSVAASATFDIQIPSCAAGYSLTGAGCRTPGFNEASWAINGLMTDGGGVVGGFCSGTNLTAGQITVEGTGQCCRVPGR